MYEPVSHTCVYMYVCTCFPYMFPIHVCICMYVCTSFPCMFPIHVCICTYVPVSHTYVYTYVCTSFPCMFPIHVCTCTYVPVSHACAYTCSLYTYVYITYLFPIHLYRPVSHAYIHTCMCMYPLIRMYICVYLSIHVDFRSYVHLHTYVRMYMCTAIERPLMSSLMSHSFHCHSIFTFFILLYTSTCCTRCTYVHTYCTPTNPYVRTIHYT